MAAEKWMVKNKKADFKEIGRRFGVSEVLARLLVNRDIKEPDQIETYLHPDRTMLYSPFLMKDVERACQILMAKIDAGARIRIIGDYDVDGVVSVYVLYTALTRLKASVDYRIPDRITDGYGINRSMIDQAYGDRVDTILTCDNGIAASDQIEHAKQLGMTVIVTDHHDIPYEETKQGKQYRIPDADAVINPKQLDCGYPFKGLCGAAVAFKLVTALFAMAGIEDQADEYIPYVAIATVCDVMDLTDENRVLVSLGLKELQKTKNPGLSMLIAENGLVPEQLGAYHLGFVLGPCLNATGRLETADRGVELLLADDPDTAAKLAAELKELNDKRKSMTKDGVEEALEIVEEELSKDMVLVVYLPDCHESLAGIVAGRIREASGKPAIVLTDSGGILKGSARSIEAYNIYEELVKCRDLLLKFGGHPLAAGMSLAKENLEEFRRRLNENCRLTKEDIIPKVSIDIVMPLGYVTEELIQELTLLEPFGKGNPKPLFAERGLILRRAYAIGKTTRFLKFRVENAYGRIMDALYFGNADELDRAITDRFGNEELAKLYQGRENAVRMSVTYYPSVNEYNGTRRLQIVIQNIMLE